MFVISVQMEPNEYAIFVVLRDNNIDRMKSYDPVKIDLAKISGPWGDFKLRDVVICYATLEDEKRVKMLCNEDKSREAVQYLTRGVGALAGE